MLPSAPTATFPYRILAKVGEGGMGTVYRAEDIELGRPVAIKALKQSFIESLSRRDAEAAIQRFVQEARAAAALSHPGVTVVHRVGAEGAWPFIAMEWLDGHTLEEVLLKRGRLSVEQAARIGLPVLSALDAAHRAGIIHRDIKPGNLFLTTDRRVKVTDFGIARVQGSTLAQTQVGAVLGTPQYAAPEQLAGQPVDARADLYAVGVVLYEVVTGRLPHDAESLFELIDRVRRGAFTPASAMAPGVPTALDDFFRRALARAPEDRFGSAAAMALALQPFLTRAVTAAAVGVVPHVAAPARVTPEVPTLQFDSATPTSLVAGVCRSWRNVPLGRLEVAHLLDRVLDKPLHTAAFCGAIAVANAILLVCDGTLFAAFEPDTGRVGDAVMDALPRDADASLHPCPEELEPRAVTLLASALSAPQARLSGLDAAYVDIGQLVAKLGAEGFDGVVRVTAEPCQGLFLFSRGRRVMDLLSHGWGRDPRVERWERWLSNSGATVSVEDRVSAFPSATFRRQLRDVTLDVVRPSSAIDAALRTDTRADADALRLQPRGGAYADRASESTQLALLDADPAVAAARWLLADVPYQFEQYRRTSRWRAMVDGLAAVSTVRVHHPADLGAGGVANFDVATFDVDGRMLHLLDRVAAGTADAVGSFIARVLASKQSAASAAQVVGAVLMAPSFSEDALDAYLGALRDSRRMSLRAAIDALTHREGFLHIGRGGCHVLLVEEVEGRRRPLVPEA